MSDRNGARELDDRIVIVVSYPILLVAASMGRLTGWRWQPWPPGGGGYESVAREAMKMAQNVAQIACAGL